MRNHDGYRAWLMFAPALIGIVLFVVMPFLLSAAFSLTNQRFVSPTPAEFVGLANYERLLGLSYVVLAPTGFDASGQPEFPRVRSAIREMPALAGFSEWFSFTVLNKRVSVLATDPVFWRSLMNNFYFSIMVVPIQSGIALILALLVHQRLRGSQIFRTIFFGPVVTSMAVMAVVWIFLYNPDYGLFNRALNTLTGGLFGNPNWLGEKNLAMPAILIMSVWQGAGFQMVLFLAGLQNIPLILYEAAEIDGANRWQRFRHVTLPGLRNATTFVVITTTIASFRLFTQVDVMTQGGPIDNATSTVVFHAIRVGFKGLSLGYASAVSFVFFLIVIAITFALRWALRDRGAVSNAA
jgi:multiple sugar transport system permease protein